MRKSLVLPTAALSLSLALTAGCTNFLYAVKDDPIKPDPYETSVGTDIDDFQIATGVGVNIKKAHPQLKQAHVNVHAYNGVILLTGEVPNAEVRTLAGDTARVFRGVRQVHNELLIQATSTMLARTNDGWLTTKVKGRLVAEKSIDSSKIKVVTESGVVYLMGTVSQDLAEKATRIASTTKGVRKVVKAFEYPENLGGAPAPLPAPPSAAPPSGATAYPASEMAPYPDTAAPPTY